MREVHELHRAALNGAEIALKGCAEICDREFPQTIEKPFEICYFDIEITKFRKEDTAWSR